MQPMVAYQQELCNLKLHDFTREWTLSNGDRPNASLIALPNTFRVVPLSTITSVGQLPRATVAGGGAA